VAPGGGPSDSPPPGGAPGARPDSPALREALVELEGSARREYYDEPRDRRAREAYYRGLPRGAGGPELFDWLRGLLKRTHRAPLRYEPMKHVYPWVDLREARPTPKLVSIYSGRDADPREFIEADAAAAAERARLEAAMRREAAFAENVLAQEGLLEFLEAQLPYNCEHVVPQSWFGKKEPMRGDLHHLFACESGCNSFRGNIPYFDFADFEEVVRDACGKRETLKFEPTAGKGPVARATLYFLLRYPGEINRTAKEYTEDRLETLLRWHEAEPPDRYEWHRNAAIQEKQGNRNPLIDFPDLAREIDFAKGLG
jgi:endonuclease G, mitochondrial